MMMTIPVDMQEQLIYTYLQ